MKKQKKKFKSTLFNCKTDFLHKTNKQTIQQSFVDQIVYLQGNKCKIYVTLCIT